MLVAAHLAGRAFTRSYVGYVHAVSHSLSGLYDLPHGRTNATLLPLVLEMYGPAVYGKLAELAELSAVSAFLYFVQYLSDYFMEEGCHYKTVFK